MYWRSYKGVTNVKLFLVLIISGLTVGAVAADPSAELEQGKALYAQTCVVCHGPDGQGAIPGVVNLTSRDGPLSKTDEVLIDSIANGFESEGSMMAMPANGGNPELTDDDVKALVAFLRDRFGI